MHRYYLTRIIFYLDFSATLHGDAFFHLNKKQIRVSQKSDIISVSLLTILSTSRIT